VLAADAADHQRPLLPGMPSRDLIMTIVHPQRLRLDEVDAVP
jgi:hypothetical protein